MSSTDYSVLGQAAPTDTNATTLYTVGAGLKVIISSLCIANISAASATYDIAIRPAGAVLANKHYIAKNCPLPVGADDSRVHGLTLEATDVITVKSGTADAFAFNLFGVEITP